MKEPFADFMKKELGPETILIACGLPASYKTETTEVISKLKDFIILRSDMIRLEVLKDEDIFDEEVASDMKKRGLVYDEMFAMAADHRWRDQRPAPKDAERRGRSQRPACPVCFGSEWLKGYTPWGCPTSTPCPQCNSKPERRRRLP